MSELSDLYRQRAELNRQIRRLLAEEAKTAPHKEVTINQMTPELWRHMTDEERRAWTNWWRGKGHVSFCCLVCGFPTAFGTVGCEACEDQTERSER